MYFKESLKNDPSTDFEKPDKLNIFLLSVPRCSIFINASKFKQILFDSMKNSPTFPL